MAVVVQLNSCSSTDSHSSERFDGVVHPGIHLTSSAFTEGNYLPEKHSRSGGNLSPPLQWDNVPHNTKSFVIICHDPDAPKKAFTHWLLYNIPPDIRKLPEGVYAARKKPFTGVSGKNSFRNQGYDGPDPPPGKTHRYYFTIYALDTTLDMKPGARKTEILDVMRGHILAEGSLMGRYKKMGSEG